MFDWLAAHTSKAIHEPSGDQRGDDADWFPNDVNCIASLPSRLRNPDLVATSPIRDECKAFSVWGKNRAVVPPVERATPSGAPIAMAFRHAREPGPARR